MVINCALAASSLVLGLIGAPMPLATRTETARPAAAALAVVDSFAPQKPKKRHPPRSAPQGAQPGTDAGDTPAEEAPAPPPPRKQSAPPAPHHKAGPAPEQDEPDRKDAATDDDEAADQPRIRHHAAHRKDAEDEEEDGEEQEDEPFASLPVVRPRLVSFGAGMSALGRQFQFNTPLQKEATFPRTGVALALETYPLIHLPRGWFRQFGVGFTYNLELGAAALAQMGGSFSYSVKQQRWAVDLRYVIPLGARVVLIPALGYGSSAFDLQGPTPVAPSTCTASGSNTGAITPPCLPDIEAGLFLADVHLRFAATPEFALSLTAGYLAGLSVGKSAGQIGSEAATTTLAGFHGEFAATMMVNTWLAVRGAVPFVTYGYKFSGGTATYASASETYYGLSLGAVLFTP